MTRLGAVLGAALVLAGCGGGGGGSATLWITRDQGAKVLLVARVPAGLTAMQALERRAEIETGYSGRFVDEIEGIGSAPGRDWFYYVNGVALDRSAAEYRLRPGDVEWWDYTAWERPNEYPAVVGAFPEPFVHGLHGRVRPAVVVGRGRVVARAPAGAAVLELRPRAGFRALGPFRFAISPRLAARLVADPHAFRYRYAVSP